MIHITQPSVHMLPHSVILRCLVILMNPSSKSMFDPNPALCPGRVTNPDRVNRSNSGERSDERGALLICDDVPSFQPFPATQDRKPGSLPWTLLLKESTMRGSRPRGMNIGFLQSHTALQASGFLMTCSSGCSRHLKLGVADLRGPYILDFLEASLCLPGIYYFSLFWLCIELISSSVSQN